MEIMGNGRKAAAISTGKVRPPFVFVQFLGVSVKFVIKFGVNYVNFVWINTNAWTYLQSAD